MAVCPRAVSAALEAASLRCRLSPATPSALDLCVCITADCPDEQLRDAVAEHLRGAAAWHRGLAKLLAALLRERGEALGPLLADVVRLPSGPVASADGKLAALRAAASAGADMAAAATAVLACETEERLVAWAAEVPGVVRPPPSPALALAPSSSPSLRPGASEAQKACFVFAAADALRSSSSSSDGAEELRAKVRALAAASPAAAEAASMCPEFSQ